MKKSVIFTAEKYGASFIVLTVLQEAECDISVEVSDSMVYDMIQSLYYSGCDISLHTEPDSRYFTMNLFEKKSRFSFSRINYKHEFTVKTEFDNSSDVFEYENECPYDLNSSKAYFLYGDLFKLKAKYYDERKYVVSRDVYADIRFKLDNEPGCCIDLYNKDIENIHFLNTCKDEKFRCISCNKMNRRSYFKI